ncbi:MAG: VWA domain-containing protein [Ruminococcus sp.]|nr:VWA domain-containing protein [Ruminococcus sp.]
MSKRFSRMAALSLTLPLIAATFASCGDDGTYSGVNSNSNYTYNYKTEAEENYSSNTVNPNEEYNYVEEGGFKDPKSEPLSTFSADVDTASYTNARRMLNEHKRVEPDSVRVEEYINYFDYKYADPEEGKVFGEYIELADCPWNPETKLMMIGLQGKRIEQEELPSSNLVFLIDSSGSMASYNKLPLVQTAFSMLTDNLTENDRISIVTYAGSSETVLEGASGDDKDEITEALGSIMAHGGTNGEGGIETAYALAEKYFIEGGNNRVILATDGDLNIGKCSEDELTKLIEKKRESGVYLSVLGFGTGNIKDNKMEALADNGNGNYSYIDSVSEARRVLVEEMGGTLFTIAKDVKIQVEFNPATVESYRLIGYDNRLMNAEDFYDDSKDAGEVGAGHAVTALYEVKVSEPSVKGTYHGIELEFATESTTEASSDNGRDELIKLSVAYKDIDTDEEIYSANLYGMEKYNTVPTQGIKLAGAVAEFAMLLKGSDYAGTSSFDYVRETALAIGGSNEKINELGDLAQKASSLYK